MELKKEMVFRGELTENQYDNLVKIYHKMHKDLGKRFVPWDTKHNRFGLPGRFFFVDVPSSVVEEKSLELMEHLDFFLARMEDGGPLTMIIHDPERTQGRSQVLKLLIDNALDMDKKVLPIPNSHIEVEE